MIAPPTARLKFRQITEADSGFIFELYSTETFKRFIADKNFQSAEDAREFIVNSLSVMYRTPGLGLMLVELKSSSAPIGICGLIKRESHTYIYVKQSMTYLSATPQLLLLFKMRRSF